MSVERSHGTASFCAQSRQIASAERSCGPHERRRPNWSRVPGRRFLRCAHLHRTRRRPWTTERAGEARPLSAWRDAPAYVLLGDAGAGKSTEFTREWLELGDGAVFRSAREFVTHEPDPDWSSKTLFIDGLDEMRVGAADSRVPLDAIRRRIQQLGSPRFRISCREADWLGSNDRVHLAAVAPDSSIRALRLNPLTGGSCS